MSKLDNCVYKGGSSCKKQGGDGSLKHSVDYVHPFPTTEEVGEPPEFYEPVYKSKEEVAQIKYLDYFFDEDLAKSILRLPFSEAEKAEELVKSLYDFDLESEEGVNKLMELLPIMDPEILSDIMEEIWPGYVVDDLPPDLMRAEIKGYLMDYLKDYGEEK